MTSETKKTAIDARPLSVAGTDEVLNADGHIVALCMRGETEDPTIAAYIVRAVNSHEMLKKFVYEVRYSSDDANMVSQSIEIIRALEKRAV